MHLISRFEEGQILEIKMMMIMMMMMMLMMIIL